MVWRFTLTGPAPFKQTRSSQNGPDAMVLTKNIDVRIVFLRFSNTRVCLVFSAVCHQQLRFVIGFLVFVNQHVATLMGVCFFRKQEGVG